jgi:predicted lipoprotein with Yx(FWY)xxD motif
MRNLKLAAAGGLGAVAVLALTYGSTVPASAAATSNTSAVVHSSARAATSNQLLIRKIGNTTVITNSKGFTLYAFAPDTSTKSNCNGSCTKFWPPMAGPVTAGSGVTGKIGTIKRSGGSTQATYNGHPLYTYVGDTKPGQDSGNNLNLSGGFWKVVPVTGKIVFPSKSSSTPGSGGGGGGY